MSSVRCCGTLLYRLGNYNQTDRGDETKGLEREGIEIEVLEREGVKELYFV